MYNWMVDFAIFQNVPDFVLIIRTLLFLSNFYKFGIKLSERCVCFSWWTLICTIVSSFLKYCDFNKLQGTFFDQFIIPTINLAETLFITRLFICLFIHFLMVMSPEIFDSIQYPMEQCNSHEHDELPNMKSALG